MVAEESAEEASSLLSIAEIPDERLTGELKMMKIEKVDMIPNSLESYLYTCYIHECLNPPSTRDILEKFYQKVMAIEDGEVSALPKFEKILKDERTARFPNLTMSQAMKLIHPLNIWELNRYMAQARISVKRAQGKNLVLIIGATAAGKSTFIQSCLGYKHIRSKDADGRRCLQIEG